MAGAADLLTKPIAGLPGGVWLMLGGAGVFVALRAQSSAKPETTVEVQEVAVPVGAVAAPDMAPLVMSPVVRINVPEIDRLIGSNEALTGALGSNTGALGQNTSGLIDNTGALIGNTGALIGNTGAVNANTGAVGGNTAATAALTARLNSVPAPAPAPAPAAAPAARTYVIRSGDTLSGITQRYTGNAGRWPELYRANAGTIDGIARSRGKSGGGHWIFPGTTLVLPW